MEIKEKLLQDLPAEAVKKHPTKTYLSSIKAIYVTERFNDVFGVGKWTTKVEKEHVNFDTGFVVVKVTFEVPELKIYYESYGGNDNGGANNKNFDLGDAYKGATTDAITKIGSYLGVGIKVFKGINDSGSHTANESKKDWCNPGDPAWNKAINNGMALDKLREYYKVSKANGEKYITELTNKIP
jgi:hypothetical protein